MQGILYEEPSFWLFLLVTCLMGGWTAWRSGRAVAKTWGGYPRLVVYVLLLGIAVRFIHHALFDGTMFSLHYYLVDVAVLLVIALLGYRRTRTRQMVTQYSWMYEPAGPFSWRERTTPVEKPV
jgi:hypothetical protein